MILRRLLGFIILFTGLSILVISLIGAFYTRTVFAGISQTVQSTLDLTRQSLSAARGTVELVRDTVDDISGGLETAVAATSDASRSLADSRLFIENVSGVTTREVPEAVEGIQSALPDIIEVAAIIDDTLTTLNSLEFSRDISLPFGGSFPLSLDLGIDYNPTSSFDESLRGFQTSLDGLPESLRGLEDDLAATNETLTSLSGNMLAISLNLSIISDRVDEMTPLLDDYEVLIDQLSVAVGDISGRVDDRLRLLQYGVVALFIAVALSQLAPIYFGWELASGRQLVNKDSLREVMYQPPPTPSLQEYQPPSPAPETTATVAEIPAQTVEADPDEGHAST